MEAVGVLSGRAQRSKQAEGRGGGGGAFPTIMVSLIKTCLFLGENKHVLERGKLIFGTVVLIRSLAKQNHQLGN